MRWYERIDAWAERKAAEYADVPGWIGLAIVVLVEVLPPSTTSSLQIVENQGASHNGGYAAYSL